jgi:predicted HicB family RNase H-like nuclease
MVTRNKAATPAAYDYATVRDAQRSPHTVTINIHLPKELHRQVRIKAVTEGLSLTQAVIEALGEWVA